MTNATKQVIRASRKHVSSTEKHVTGMVSKEAKNAASACQAQEKQYQVRNAP